MKPDFFAKVGKANVPVVCAESPTLVHFRNAQRGKNGMYAFWTAEFKKPMDGKAAVWGRAKIGLCAGDRFARMEIERRTASVQAGKHVYEDYWTRLMRAGNNIKQIRPSTSHELLLWLDSHSQDKFGKWRLVK